MNLKTATQRAIDIGANMNLDVRTFRKGRSGTYRIDFVKDGEHRVSLGRTLHDTLRSFGDEKSFPAFTLTPPPQAGSETK